MLTSSRHSLPSPLWVSLIRRLPLIVQKICRKHLIELKFKQGYMSQSSFRTPVKKFCCIRAFRDFGSRWAIQVGWNNFWKILYKILKKILKYISHGIASFAHYVDGNSNVVLASHWCNYPEIYLWLLRKYIRCVAEEDQCFHDSLVFFYGELIPIFPICKGVEVPTPCFSSDSQTKEPTSKNNYCW